MKTKTSLLLLSILFSIQSFAQSGTSGDPFTSLYHSNSVPSAGVYYFDISGATFNTYVDINGYILIAIDFGDGIGSLPSTTSLDLTSRGIINSTTLTHLTTQTEVRISSSTGNTDVTTTNPAILSRITSNSSLHSGTTDNGINNDWTGTGAIAFTADASGTTLTPNELHRKIFHPHGNSATFHWQPSIDQQREIHSSGEIANNQSLRLWIKDNSATLPVALNYFDAKLEQSNVTIEWSTSSEINNDYFTIERSNDGINWNDLNQVEGAGNSFSLIQYSSTDTNPFPGVSYYRLKQTDFDGRFSYSEIKSIQNDQNIEAFFYPNPANDFVTLRLGELDIKLDGFKIYNLAGQDLSQYFQLVSFHENEITYDITLLPRGLYYVRNKLFVRKLIKL